MNLFDNSPISTPKIKLDRLSSLPDEVLSQILSLIPTKYAVATSILSKRWRYIWTYVTNLDIDFTLRRDPYPDDHDVARFVNFVDRVFHLCNSLHIQKVRLHCYEVGVDRSRVSAWINDAVRRNVEVLDIDMHELELPSSLFTSKTLTDLTVAVGFGDVMNIPSSIYLPCLKILEIQCDYPPEDLSEKLFCSCPVLEELYLEGIVGESYRKVHTFNISTTTLKRLEIRLRVALQGGEVDHKVIINAPNLEYIYLEDNFLAKYVLEDVSSLYKAKVNVGTCTLSDSDSDPDPDEREYRDRAFELLRAISDVEILSLYSGTIGCIEFPDCYKLPTFHNLTWLEVVIHDFCGWSLLPKIFEISPNLEVFCLKKERLHGNLGATDEELVEELFFFEPEPVPKCFLSLEEIEITGFKGNRYEMDVLAYLLGNAEGLESLTIKSGRLTRKKEADFYAQLLKFPRASNDCQIEFLGKFISMSNILEDSPE